MKLIVSNLESLRTYVSREFYFIMRDLISTHGWRHIEMHKLWNGAGTIRDKLIDEFGELPGSILFWQAHELLRHYLPVSKGNLEERIQYVLDERNHEELDEIRRSGQRLVWERHKTVDRASQINEECSV